MLEFSDTPPDDPRGHALPLTRTPTAGNLMAIVTSENLVGTYTHFFKGRTIPHDHDDCQPCNAGMPFRWHAWVSALTTRTREHILFEMTKQAAQTFKLYFLAHGTLRGALFQACRPSRKANGRIHIQIKPIDVTKEVLPTAPDLVKCLSIIWNLASTDIALPIHLNGGPAMCVADTQTKEPVLANKNGKRF